MLEFYSVHPGRIGPIIAAIRLSTIAISSRVNMRALAIAMVSAALLAGCATAPMSGVQPAPAPPPPVPTAPPMPRNAEPPPPPINLSGFPLPYRQGYADGCASAKGAERKDASRFGADPNYRTGWQDGIALCKKK
jgi:hypothetical protein